VHGLATPPPQLQRHQSLCPRDVPAHHRRARAGRGLGITHTRLRPRSWPLGSHRAAVGEAEQVHTVPGPAGDGQRVQRSLQRSQRVPSAGQHLWVVWGQLFAVLVICQPPASAARTVRKFERTIKRERGRLRQVQCRCKAGKRRGAVATAVQQQQQVLVEAVGGGAVEKAQGRTKRARIREWRCSSSSSSSSSRQRSLSLRTRWPCPEKASTHLRP